MFKYGVFRVSILTTPFKVIAIVRISRAVGTLIFGLCYVRDVIEIRLVESRNSTVYIPQSLC